MADATNECSLAMSMPAVLVDDDERMLNPDQCLPCPKASEAVALAKRIVSFPQTTMVAQGNAPDREVAASGSDLGRDDDLISRFEIHMPASIIAPYLQRNMGSQLSLRSVFMCQIGIVRHIIRDRPR